MYADNFPYCSRLFRIELPTQPHVGQPLSHQPVYRLLVLQACSGKSSLCWSKLASFGNHLLQLSHSLRSLLKAISKPPSAFKIIFSKQQYSIEVRDSRNPARRLSRHCGVAAGTARGVVGTDAMLRVSLLVIRMVDAALFLCRRKVDIQLAGLNIIQV